MNVTVNADLDITIVGATKEAVEHACRRFDNYYDLNGLNWMQEEEQADGSWIIYTEWSALCSLPTQETIKEQFENYLKEEC